ITRSIQKLLKALLMQGFFFSFFRIDMHHKPKKRFNPLVKSSCEAISWVKHANGVDSPAKMMLHCKCM
ncbi:hypothetical protein, partial [Brevibacillus agri]|uniref:hypothetical protein n=1 Tax=Brevibacillus agri TaxID=51101 RepID=UPI003D25A653